MLLIKYNFFHTTMVKSRFSLPFCDYVIYQIKWTKSQTSFDFRIRVIGIFSLLMMYATWIEI